MPLADEASTQYSKYLSHNTFFGGNSATIMPPDLPPYIFYENSYSRFRGKPLADDYDFRLNSRGFKDVERKKEKEPNVYRILGLGDSFAFGVIPLIPKGHRHGPLTRPEGGKTSI